MLLSQSTISVVIPWIIHEIPVCVHPRRFSYVNKPTQPRMFWMLLSAPNVFERVSFPLNSPSKDRFRWVEAAVV